MLIHIVVRRASAWQRAGDMGVDAGGGRGLCLCVRRHPDKNGVLVTVDKGWGESRHHCFCRPGKQDPTLQMFALEHVHQGRKRDHRAASIISMGGCFCGWVRASGWWMVSYQLSGKQELQKKPWASINSTHYVIYMCCVQIHNPTHFTEATD